MKEAFEKIKKSLKEEMEKCTPSGDDYYSGRFDGLNDALEIVNQVAEEYKSLLTDTDLVKALRCLGSQTADGDCYETSYNMQHMDDEDYKPMRCRACTSETEICCPYHQNTYEVCFEDGDCWWLREVAEIIELIAGTNVHCNAFDIIYNKVCKLEQQYAKVEGNMEAVNDCIRLENLLQYFKEELRDENNQSLANNNQSLTNGGWILCSQRLPDVPEGIEDSECPEFNVTIKGAELATTLKYAPDGTWFDDDGEIYKVIAWQPLPVSYNPKGESQ